MFAKTIIDSDAFLDLPLSAQAFYFHLSMRADDDGFINNPKKIQRMIGASDGDAQLLLQKRFVIAFASGVVVIKHWRIHNYIQKDRYKPTVYTEEKAMLTEKGNGAYTMDTGCIQDVSKLEAQDRLEIGKEMEGKDSKGDCKGKSKFSPPSLEDVRAYCKERHNSVDAEIFVDWYTANGWKVGKNTMKDWKAAVRTWEKRNNNPTSPKSRFQMPDYDSMEDLPV